VTAFVSRIAVCGGRALIFWVARSSDKDRFELKLDNVIVRVSSEKFAVV
jgi:hypothetical protein